MGNVMDPAFVDPALDSRAITFENPTGARGGGGTAGSGRKGSPSRVVEAGERVVLASLDGPGVVRHLWMTVLAAPPERLRALMIEVFYDGAEQPSISAPMLDLFCLPHGRRAPFSSALVDVHEGRGFNSTIPMPFAHHARIEFVNSSKSSTVLYYQIDYTVEPAMPDSRGYLHVAFRRQNPTSIGSDAVIVEGFRGPGRFLGCAIGIRTIDPGMWYGEGEVKIFRDGDTGLPTVCGTGLEDYVGSAWGMGPHSHPYGGCTLDVRPPSSTGPLSLPDFVGMYRWHLPDPVMFSTDIRVTLQQIGSVILPPGQEATMVDIEESGRLAGNGWERIGGLTFGLVERIDDVCAVGFVYCTKPQAVPRVDAPSATADVERRDYEIADPMEAIAGAQ